MQESIKLQMAPEVAKPPEWLVTMSSSYCLTDAEKKPRLSLDSLRVLRKPFKVKKLLFWSCVFVACVFLNISARGGFVTPDLTQISIVYNFVPAKQVAAKMESYEMLSPRAELALIADYVYQAKGACLDQLTATEGEGSPEHDITCSWGSGHQAARSPSNLCPSSLLFRNLDHVLMQRKVLFVENSSTPSLCANLLQMSTGIAGVECNINFNETIRSVDYASADALAAEFAPEIIVTTAYRDLQSVINTLRTRFPTSTIIWAPSIVSDADAECSFYLYNEEAELAVQMGIVPFIVGEQSVCWHNCLVNATERLSWRVLLYAIGEVLAVMP
eukprot:Colp12_sorted_trinity150504_noHs@13770